LASFTVAFDMAPHTTRTLPGRTAKNKLLDRLSPWDV
jgi:hypothetical protein